MRVVPGWIIFCVSLFVAALVAGLRWHYESAIPRLVPTDAQGSIFTAYSAVISIATFIVCFALLCSALIHLLSERKHRVNGILALCAFLFIAGCTGNTLREHASAKQALVDAANPMTAPERLHELIGSQSGFGYEVDNRIAANPNTTQDTLRALSRRSDQGGTLLVLAENPNTPEDVILELSRNPDELLQGILKKRAHRD